ncbi:hypothetical protein [Psychromonas ossibalaenae]|uniref:hypothetical protein n=1 Tax=Psychromonas ossibalaenae TaxID=444922 RepID=UPI0003828BC9|nr:hypothetical protein [Psychromonas ossibalaenae]
MGKIYNISLLPNQQAISSVANLSHEFEQAHVNLNNSLFKLKQTISESGFMEDQDYRDWFYTHGCDYSANPKLFAQAPLNFTCAYLSEIFKRYKIEQISSDSSTTAIKRALLRLDTFRIDS